jgi:hypothetical protein
MTRAAGEMHVENHRKLVVRELFPSDEIATVFQNITAAK